MGLYLAGIYLIGSIDWNALGGRAWQIGSVAAGLGFVIFVHELGHFLVAKWCGVKCEKFYVGFDVPINIFGLQLPSKLFHFQWGETEYGVGIIPLGGYVKMLGQDDDPRAAQAEMERIRVKKSKDEPTENDEPTNADSSTAATTATLASESSSQHDEYELDPRSFPAKTVPQRMAIISAGVIMNLIFAVIFASSAYRAGVPYTPCEVGHVYPGSPAWSAGIEEQSRIVQIGETEKRKSFLRFTWDLRNGVAMADEGMPVVIVTQDAEGAEHRYEVVPDTVEIPSEKSRLFGIFKRPPDTQKILGITSASVNRLHKKQPTTPNSSASKAETKLLGDDTIAAVNGTKITSAYQLEEVLAANATDPITLTIERKAAEGETESVSKTLEVIVEPNPIHRVGLVMKTGPIVAIRPNSPAAEAGFQVGDTIETISGEPIEDPLSLPTQLRPFHDQEIEVQVNRGNELVTLHVTPQTPREFDWTFSINSPMSSVALGVAFQVNSIVQSVVPDSPADKAGIKPGDNAIAFMAKYDKPRDRDEERANAGTPFPLDDKNVTWPYAVEAFQHLKEGTSLHISIKRDGQVSDFAVKTMASEDFNPDRGLVLAMKSETYVAKSWGEAVSLGASRTLEDATRVATFLKKLVTGQIALTNVGGPLVIAAVAGSEASEGLPRLLIFLTFLSANLAVVNFMPVPALDGGHFIFLLWEGISGKPVNERVQIALTLAGVGCLLCLMIFVVGLDIDRLFF